MLYSVKQQITLKPSITQGATGADAGTYTGLATTTSSATGSGATVTVVVPVNGNVSTTDGTITVVNQGTGYQVGDKLIIDQGLVTNANQNIEITLTVSNFTGSRVSFGGAVDATGDLTVAGNLNAVGGLVGMDLIIV